MKNNVYQEGYELYKQGYSLADVGKVLGVTRQSVYDCFKRRNFKLRKKKLLPFVIYDKLKWTLNYNGYYRNTKRKMAEQLMHRYMWEKEVGKIPMGWDIHHKNEDKIDNRIENFECLPKAEHTRLYSSKCNQHSHKCKNYENHRQT